MYRVLVPVDQNEDRAQRISETLIGFPGAHDEFEVILLHVFQDMDQEEAEGPRVSNEEVYDLDTPPEVVQTIADRLEANGFSVVIELEVGDTLDSILSVADEYDVDQIVMGGRQRSRVGKFVFGSITQGVLLNSEVPVTATITDA